jgi:hypothetical protein
VFIGIESFDQDVLNRYRKGTTVAQNDRAIAILKDLGIRLRMGFITFDHFTTYESLRGSIARLRAIVSDRGHLITQPIFFYNVMAPLEDTPLGREYREIGAVLGGAQGPSDSLQLEHQRRIVRGGSTTTFADATVQFISELARVLASEVLQRTTWLENVLARSLGGPSDVTLPCDLKAARHWLEGLTAFALDQLERIVIDAEGHISDETHATAMANRIVTECDSYDMRLLGFPVPREREILSCVFS